MAQMTFRYRTEPIEVDGEIRNYFVFCSCGCYGENCLEYNGEVPNGFPFDVDIRCYYLQEIDGVKTIIHDTIRELELEEQDKKEEENNRHLIGLDKEELEEKIEDQELINDEQSDLLANHGNRITALEMGGEFNFAVGNNLLYGTSMTSQTPWMMNWFQCEWVESQTPPEYSDEWWFGGYWYCTKDYLTYKKGNMYHYENGEWILSDKTKYDLVDGLAFGSIQFINNEFTNTNFISGKAAMIEDEEDGIAVELGQTIQPIYNNYDDLTLSFKIQNNLVQGVFKATLGFCDKYDVSQYIRCGMENYMRPIYRETLEITPDECNNLTEVKIKIPMQKQSVLLYGYAGETPPEDKTLYWINTTQEASVFRKLFEYKNGEWVESDKKNTVRIGDSYYIYEELRFGINEGVANTKQYRHSSIREDITTYRTECINLALGSMPVYLNYVGEEEPIPEKGFYWGKPSTDEVFRAKYNGETFVEWELTGTTYTETVGYGPEDLPKIPAKGNIIIGDIKLEYGNYTIWSPNPNEIEGGNIDITNKHIILYKDSGNKVMFTGEEISVYNNKEKIFDIDGDVTYTKIHHTIESDIDGLVTKKMKANDKTIYIRYIR